MSYPLKTAVLGLALLVAPGLSGCGDDGGSTSSSGTGAQNTGGDGGSVQGGAGGMGAGTATGATGGTGAGPTTVTCDMGEYTNLTQGECDLLQQDCPAGNTCAPVDGDAGAMTTECIPANGLKPIGELCAGQNECQAGLFCVFDRCSPVCCNGENDQPCDGGACNLHLSLTQDTDEFMWVCTYLEPCEPLVADTCPDDQQCQIEQEGVMSCLPPSGANKMEGEDCNFNNDCGSQQACIQDICRWLCWTDNMGEAPGLGGCPMNQTCQAANTGFQNLGFCIPD